MSKRFTENELRAYSKNRFEERLLRRRLDKLKDEATIYHDDSTQKRINLVEESKGIRKTSGGSPVPASLIDADEDFVLSQRIRRPWAYSLMETTYNNVYREAEIPLPGKQRGRQRPKSAATTMLGNASVVTFPLDRSKTQKTDPSQLQRVTKSATYAGKNVPVVKEPRNTKSENSTSKAQIKVTESVSQLDCGSSGCVDSEASQKLSDSDSLLNLHIRVPSPNEVSAPEDEGLKRSSNTWVKDDALDNRPYARVLKLPPAYTIDSKTYQDAERDRLLSRSRSRVGFSSSGAANIKESTSSKNKPDKPQEKKSELKPDSTLAKDNQSQESILKKDEEHSAHGDNEVNNKNVLKAKENVMFKGHIIRNYIRPEDRYKLDPSVLNRHQNRMEKLAKESSTFLKRVNHENIKVEIAFPRSARKRLLTKLVQDNNSGKKKTVSNDDGPIIQTKVERFMVSMTDYIERQQLDRANTFIY